MLVNTEKQKEQIGSCTGVEEGRRDQNCSATALHWKLTSCIKGSRLLCTSLDPPPLQPVLQSVKVEGAACTAHRLPGQSSTYGAVYCEKKGLEEEI